MASPPSSVNPAAPAAEPASTPVPQVPQKSRLESVDLLRGLVMVAMALDHTRDFFHTGAIHGVDPLDLSTTTLPLFFTRWLTHFCAPVFVFLAGTGAFLSTTRGKSTGELSRFLFTRGLWLVFLELSWVQWLGWSFTMNLRVHAFLVIWAIGWSMIALSVLVHFRPAVIL
ncbi:MAG TPA: heparan-alpha-glucosaminide N-acetyltransferase domain-containing protein, partial [Candidatus Dormibacteraeota bacterium]|nr:heparan-alpha-glucosaminide N-acetyltransferase domain-containing protein [Candidatus Dormibacteraeota bacterium]